jgi:hypothetical protein
VLTEKTVPILEYRHGCKEKVLDPTPKESGEARTHFAPE